MNARARQRLKDERARAHESAGPQVLSTAKRGDTVKLFGGDVQVQAPCDSKHGGNWHCLTHNRTLKNQLQKDIHIHGGTHRMIWICPYHGPEEP